MVTKVFCVGVGKTGTTSLHKACKLLGLTSLHNRFHTEPIVQEAKQRREHPLLARYDAFWDAPLLLVPAVSVGAVSGGPVHTAHPRPGRLRAQPPDPRTA